MSSSEPVSSSRGVLSELNLRFRAPLNRYFQRREIDAAEAEDLTQEVFLRIARRENGITRDNIEAFIFTIAGNLLRDRRRRRQVRGVQVSLDGDQPINHTELIEAIDPSRVVTARDDLRRALAILGELPQRTQDVFILQRIEGMKNRQIADTLSISVSAVEKHMSRALAHMARRFHL